MTLLSLPAPAKVNLSLAVTGRRDDGYHELDSLVVFAEAADLVAAEPAETLTLAVEGPFAAALESEADNLVLRAARLFGAEQGARLTLTKNLPVAAGLGGGSGDAAAALRLLAELWKLPLPMVPAVALGADLPVCLGARPARVGGIGEVVLPVELPDFALLLVNPGFPLSTAEVFRAYASAAGAASAEPPPCPPRFADLHALLDHLLAVPNDLEAPARALQPEIGDVLEALALSDGCLLARMSGSGPTCFGLFAKEAEARAAGESASAARPHWWVRAAGLFQPRGIA